MFATTRDGRTARLTVEETILCLLVGSSMPCRKATAPVLNALANLSRKGEVTRASGIWSVTAKGRARAARLNAQEVC